VALQDLIGKRKNAICERCVRLVCETYGAETASSLKTERDLFANPVGAAIRGGVEALVGVLTGEITMPELQASLDPVVRVRAVQDFVPSKAVAFVFLLKQAVREELSGELHQHGHAAELEGVDRQIDQMALVTFDLYAACRERVGEIRVKEARAAAERLTRVVRAMSKDGE
jgi:hypothetical protein